MKKYVEFTSRLAHDPATDAIHMTSKSDLPGFNFTLQPWHEQPYRLAKDFLRENGAWRSEAVLSTPAPTLKEVWSTGLMTGNVFLGIDGRGQHAHWNSSETVLIIRGSLDQSDQWLLKLEGIPKKDYSSSSRIGYKKPITKEDMALDRNGTTKVLFVEEVNRRTQEELDILSQAALNRRLLGINFVIQDSTSGTKFGFDGRTLVTLLELPGVNSNLPLDTAYVTLPGEKRKAIKTF